MSRTRRRFFLPAVSRGALLLAGKGYPDARFADGPGDSQGCGGICAASGSEAFAEAPSAARCGCRGNPLACRVQPSAAPSDCFTGADLAACQAQNGDFIAWLSIPERPSTIPWCAPAIRIIT